MLLCFSIQSSKGFPTGDQDASGVKAAMAVKAAEAAAVQPEYNDFVFTRIPFRYPGNLTAQYMCIFLNKRRLVMKKSEISVFFKYSFSLIKEYKLACFFTLLLVLVEIICNKFEPYFLGMLIDTLGNNENVYRVVVTMVILLVAGYTSAAIKNFNLSRITNRIIFSLKDKVFNNIISMEIEKIEGISSGELYSRYENDINTIGNTAISRNVSFFSSIINIIILSIIIFNISISLSIFILVMFPISYYITIYGGNKIRKYISLYKRDLDKYTSFFNEVTGNLGEVKSLTCEESIKSKMNIFQKEFYHHIMKKILTEEGMKLVSSIVYTIIFIGFIIIGTAEIHNNKLTIGAFVAFNTYFVLFYSALKNIISIYSSIQESIVSIQRISNKIEEFQTEASDGVNRCEFNNIIIRQLRFSYTNDYIVLDGINLSFQKNKIYALVGESGEGKSTIFKLLMRFYSKYEGDILIDHKDIKTISKSNLRENICLVQQEPEFFNDTIKNNFILAKPSITDEEIIQACEYVGLKELVEKLPMGIESNIYEQSKNISIGQKQRLAIARGLVRDCRIFLLDEITSNIDAKNKNKIIDLVNDLKENRIIVMITHDYDVMKKVDFIYMLDKGKITYEGEFNIFSECSTLNNQFQVG